MDASTEKNICVAVSQFWGSDSPEYITVLALLSASRAQEPVYDTSVVKRIATQMGWISVGDKLPDSSGNYILYRPSAHLRPACDPNVTIRKFDGSRFSGAHEVTHWMPIPAAPTPERADAEIIENLLGNLLDLYLRLFPNAFDAAILAAKDSAPSEDRANKEPQP